MTDNDALFLLIGLAGLLGSVLIYSWLGREHRHEPPSPLIYRQWKARSLLTRLINIRFAAGGHTRVRVAKQLALLRGATSAYLNELIWQAFEQAGYHVLRDDAPAEKGVDRVWDASGAPVLTQLSSRSGVVSTRQLQTFANVVAEQGPAAIGYFIHLGTPLAASTILTTATVILLEGDSLVQLIEAIGSPKQTVLARSHG